MTKTKIALGCDGVGFELKEILKKYLVEEKNAQVVLDVCPDKSSIPEPTVVTDSVCRAIQKDECRLGLLICGTGLGFNHMANTFWGVRAASVSDCYTAERARKSADVQVLCLGARVLAPEYAKKVLDAWYDEPFSWDRTSSVINKGFFREIDDQDLKKPDDLAWGMGWD